MKLIRHKPRIDWLTFSWVSLFNTVENMQNHIQFIKDILCFQKFEEQYSRSTLIMEGEDIYICFRSGLIYIQFRGSFYYRYPDYYEKIRNLMILTSRAFSEFEPLSGNRFLTLSKRQIAQDFEDVGVELFESEIESSRKRICFSQKPVTYGRNPRETYSLNSSKSQNNFYRKDIESRKEKNEYKRKWFQEKFGDKAVVRFENTVNESANLLDETFIFYTAEYDEDFFTRYSLDKYYQKHRLRLKRNSKNQSLWPDCPFWYSLFHPVEEFRPIDEIYHLKKGDYRVKNKKANFTKSMNNVVDFLVKQEEKENLLLDYYKQSESEYLERQDQENQMLKKTESYFKAIDDIVKKAA